MIDRWTLALAIAIAGAVTVGARQTRQTDPIPALLTEVRALRIAMEQSAAIAPRVQLTLARPNIEEQRIAQLASQLDRARQQLTDASFAVTKASDELADVEKLAQTVMDDKQRTETELQRTFARRQLAERSATEQQLRTRETQAAQMLATVQSRRMELNSRLDELEKLLRPIRQ